VLTATIEIRNPAGLHIRPGTDFVRRARTFASEVQIRKGHKTANAKSLVRLLQIGISQGDTIELTCEGADERDALASLTQFLTEWTE
jgi:phosphocarrier protein HPr